MATLYLLRYHKTRVSLRTALPCPMRHCRRTQALYIWCALSSTGTSSILIRIPLPLSYHTRFHTGRQPYSLPLLSPSCSHSHASHATPSPPLFFFLGRLRRVSGEQFPYIMDVDTSATKGARVGSPIQHRCKRDAMAHRSRQVNTGLLSIL